MILRFNLHLKNGEVKIIDYNTEKSSITTDEKLEICNKLFSRGGSYIGNKELSLFVNLNEIVYCDVEEIEVI